jgi:hypothetical protein
MRWQIARPFSGDPNVRMRARRWMALVFLGLVFSWVGRSLWADPAIVSPSIGRDLLVPAAHEIAVREITTAFDQDGVGSAYRLRDLWAKPLWESKDYARVEQFSVRAIRAAPWDTGLLEHLCVLRARGMMAQHNDAGGIGCSKQLYDIASMPGTGAAMLVVERALHDAGGDWKGRMETFKREQMAGAVERHDRGANALLSGPIAADTSPFMQGLHGDAGPFESALGPLLSEDFTTLTGRGNLLLLCGRPGEALGIFGRAYAVAADNQVPLATENIARALKAEDGAIGRANSWLNAVAGKRP